MPTPRIRHTDDLAATLAELIPADKYDQIAILCDSNTREYCLNKLPLAFRQQAILITVPAGESHKDLGSAELVWEKLLDENFTRQSLLLNLGGGVVTDLGGFAAGAFKRGIPYMNLPTTLMGMADAAIGGKTALNLKGYKNQVGLFALPEAVIIYPPFLQSLLRRELLSGFAEIIKYALLKGEPWWGQVRENKANTLWDTALVAPCAQYKEEIVEQDPFEKGLRKILNLGHTLGHAFESLSHNGRNPLAHGEAVAYGLLAEAGIAREKLGLPEKTYQELAEVITRLYARPSAQLLDRGALMPYLLNDKKNAGSEIRFVLLKNLGEPVRDVTCTENEISTGLNYLAQAWNTSV